MQKSGFFNALNVNGQYDRTYNANDYCDNLAVVIGNGVLRSKNDDLRVTSSGMLVTVGVGRAWINGHYYVNDTAHTFAPVTAPTGGARYDRVFLRLNKDLAVRSISLVYQQGTASNSPAKPAPVREGNIYDIVLADIYVGTNATSVIVTDTRDDANICGWIYSTSGDGSFFKSLDASFNAWFENTKDTLSSVTLFKRYEWRTVLESATNTVTFNIPQYDAETSFFDVYVNGLIVTANVDYTATGAMLTFNGTLIAGTEIEVKCYKSIDGTGIMSVADEITEIQNILANINAANTYFYNCNGVNDNVVISDMAQAYLNGGDDNGELTITIVGEFGATAPYSGEGTTSNPFVWFDIGKPDIVNRRVTLDFSGCNAMKLSQGDYVYSLFKGRQYTIKNLCADIDGVSSYIYGQNIYFGAKNVYFENCRINVTAREGWLFNFGTFRDCEMTFKSESDRAAVFRPQLSSDMIRIYGGEYQAYTSGNYVSAVIYCAADVSSAVIVADGLNCPTRAVSGYQQTHAVYDLATSNYHRYLNITSELILHAPSQTVRDTIVANK